MFEELSSAMSWQMGVAVAPSARARSSSCSTGGWGAFLPSAWKYPMLVLSLRGAHPAYSNMDDCAVYDERTARRQGGATLIVNFRAMVSYPARWLTPFLWYAMKSSTMLGSAARKRPSCVGVGVVPMRAHKNEPTIFVSAYW